MEKLITVLFNSEEEAFKASQAISQLAADGDIMISELYVLRKDESGKVIIKNSKNEEIPYTATGALAGSIIGILGGPLGVLIGLTAGTLAGGIGDFINYSKSSKFLKKATDAIPEGKTAIVANINEYWETPLDTTLKPFDAEVKRLNVGEEIDKYIVAQQKELDEKIKKIKDDIKEASDEQKEKLNARLEELKTKRENLKLEIKEKSETQKNKISNWFEDIKTKFTNWKEEVREEISEEVEEIKEEYDELLFQIKTGLKMLSNQSKDNFKEAVDYFKETIEDINEGIDDLEEKIEKISGESKEKWELKLAELKDRRNELLLKTREEIEIQKTRFRLWLDGADSKLAYYEADLKEKSVEVKQNAEQYRKELLEKQIAYHQKRIEDLESKK